MWVLYNLATDETILILKRSKQDKRYVKAQQLYKAHPEKYLLFKVQNSVIEDNFFRL